MRKVFYAVVFLAAAIAFYQSNLATSLFRGGGDSVSSWFNKISDAAEQSMMSDFRKEAEPIFAGLRPQQIEYAGHVMKDRETLGVFYLNYCEQDDKNPYIYGVTLSEFCEQISRAGILNR